MVGAPAGVRSVKRAQVKPLLPLQRSVSNTSLRRNSVQHLASNIPVSKLLNGRTRSSSRGPNGPTSKASSGFASRSSSFSDVHRETLKRGKCTFLLKFMAKIEKMYEEPPPRRSYHWLPIDSQLEAESNSRVTCQEPFTEALLGKPALVHKPRTGLICCRALPSSMRALRPHPVRRIRPQASGAPPPQRVCSPDFILNSGEATKHCADEQVSAEADLSPQTGSVFIYPQCPLARPRLDYDRESGRDWWRASFLTKVAILLFFQVKKQLAQCTCCNRIHLQRLDEGRYQLGKRIYYMRRFRSHIMVRVGGGWLTLKEFLDRYDPCRQKEGQLTQTTTGTGTAIMSQVKGSPAVPTKFTVPAADLLGSWTSSTELQCPAFPVADAAQGGVFGLVYSGRAVDVCFVQLVLPAKQSDNVCIVVIEPVLVLRCTAEDIRRGGLDCVPQLTPSVLNGDVPVADWKAG
ncbi:unnamed protein product [Schistocephalus solidus]|uniref:GAR domain-containing protein n=1 Tax=Schistocephalus solidus TaxID=70667 RepID=A0A183TEC4_SCHSO|nr:unnamed protein product [Schistocephalus solidus]